MHPGFLHPENQQLLTSRLFINHSRTSGVVLWSYHANIARGSTSHCVRDVDLERRIQKVEKKTKFSWTN